jgi:hypothetical protein
MLTKNRCLVNGLAAICMCYQNPLYAHNWRLMPSLQLQEVYSDNITLAPSDKARAGFVTALSPAAFIVWQAGKSSLNLRYNMQNLYNAHGDGAYGMAHQLQFNAHNVLAKNRFFVDSRASISQQNINNTRVVADNFTGAAGSTTTVSTFGVSPTWLPHFGNYANGTVRVNADTFSSGASSLSNSETISETVQLNSGSKFKRVSWSAGFNNSQTYRSGGGDVSFQNANLTLRSYIDKHFSVFASGGYSDNVFSNATNTSTTAISNANGFFYTAGVRWSPSTHYWLEVGGGNNSYVTLSLAPMQRLSLLATVRNNDIGLNPGTTWQAALNYRTRRSHWSFTHNNSTTTSQSLLSQSEPGTGTPLIPVNNTILTNDIIVVQSSNLSASFYTGKSTFSLGAYLLDYTYQRDPLNQQNQIKDQNIKGISGQWSWQFARKTSAYIRPLWQQIDSTNGNNTKLQSERYDFAIGLNQAITNRISGNLELRHVTQTSNAASTVLNSDYQENRATASLFMRF